MLKRINHLLFYGVVGIGLTWQVANFFSFSSPLGKTTQLLSYSPPQLVSCGQDLGDQFLSSPGQADTFLINLRAGDLFRIQMAFQADGPSEQLDLYDPSGNLLTSSVQNGPGANVLQWPISELGVYTIVAAAEGGTTTGFYGISFQNDNRPACASIVSCGEEVNSLFPLAGIEAFSFQANQNDSLRIQLQFLDESKTPSIQLFDPTGNPLVSFIAQDGEQVVLTYDDLPQSGNYVVLVTEATGQESGFFGISFQLLAESCALAVDCQTDAEGAISSPAGMEAFSLAAEAGDTLLVQLRYETEDIIPALYLYSPDGSLLDSIVGTANELLVFSFEGLPVTGNYLVLASSPSKTTPGDFGISFQLFNTNSCTKPFLTTGCEDSDFVSIKGLAEMQTYTFSGDSGEFVAFQLEPSTAEFSGSLRLYDPQGKLIQEAMAAAGELAQIAPFALPETGNYILIVSEAEGDDTGIHSLTGQRLTTTGDIDQEFSICPGESVFVGGAAQTEAGTYYDLQVNDNGCDSILVTAVVLAERVDINVVEAICFGDTLRLRGNSYTETDIYEIFVPNPSGCDTLISLDLLLIEPVESIVNDTICAGQIYTLGRQGYSQSGTYRDTLCDTIVSLSLTVLPLIETIIDTTICQGSFIEVSTFRYLTSGSYSNLLETSSGCDSLVTVELTVDPLIETQIDTTICTGQWIEINNVRYFDTGSYSSLLETEGGCDSLVSLQLTVIPLIETQIDTTICFGQWIEVGTFKYFESGPYSNLLETSTGCDSLVSLNLTVLPPPTTVIDTIICEGEWVEVNNTRYSETGAYPIFLETVNNCDSLVDLTLTVLDSVVHNVAISLCEGSSFTIGNTAYSTTGNYSQTLTGSNGCDSTVNLNLMISNIVFTNLEFDICEGASVTVNQIPYFETGFYTDTITTSTGCDSIISLQLRVADQYQIAIDSTICEGNGIQIGDSLYTTTGFYVDTLSTVDFCDSIISLQLRVEEISETLIDTTICSGQFYEFGGIELEESGVYRDTVLSSLGCDSLLELRLNILPPPITNTSFRICEGDSLVINNTAYTLAGTYIDTLQTAVACDSILAFDLSIVPIIRQEQNQRICQGEFYLFAGDSLRQGGDYIATFTSSLGCDSIIELSLEVIATSDTLLTISICEGEAYTVGTDRFTEAGDYTIPLLNQQNCDSTVRLNLSVIPQVNNAISARICEGELYSVGNSEYKQSGAYVDTLVSSLGCDSIVSLNLSVESLPVFELSGETNLCEGETSRLLPSNSYTAYEWSTGDRTAELAVTTAGTYTLTVTDDNGCRNSLSRSVQVSQLSADITPTPYPNGFNISCPSATDGQLTGIAFNGIAPYTWQWNTGDHTAAIDQLGPGLYESTVTDAFGCEAEVGYELQAPPEFTFSIDIIPPLCVDEGGIVDVLVDGQTGPYTFQLGAIQQNMGLFEDVGAGISLLSVTDANGCQQEATIEIPQAEFLLTQSFEQASISEGDSLQLEIGANFPIDKIRWEPARWLSCSDCPNPVARPEATTIYRAFVFSESGCDLNANFRIDVGPFDGFFIPNSFSPNGDGVNDRYFFHADERVEMIEEVMIFDRWGKLLFQRSDLAPNNPDLGWDGNDQNRPAQVGVYTYYVTIKLYNGQTKVYKGDLTLLR